MKEFNKYKHYYALCYFSCSSPRNHRYNYNLSYCFILLSPSTSGFISIYLISHSIYHTKSRNRKQILYSVNQMNSPIPLGPAFRPENLSCNATILRFDLLVAFDGADVKALAGHLEGMDRGLPAEPFDE